MEKDGWNEKGRADFEGLTARKTAKHLQNQAPSTKNAVSPVAPFPVAPFRLPGSGSRFDSFAAS